jgi:tetratricopeptide (TPR) repeat protein
MDPTELLTKYISNRNSSGILEVMFQRVSPNPPSVRDGFFKEDELWDYKQDIPPSGRGNDAQWANIAADVLAFHNTRGGVLVFGIRNGDFQFTGASHSFDTKLFNDKIRRYVGDRFWVSFSREYIQHDQRYLGLAVIPPKAHAAIRVLADSPPIGGRQSLKIGDLCIRRGDETKILRGSNALTFLAEHRVGESASLYAVNEPNFRVLRPDYRQFTYRKDLCGVIEQSLKSDRTFTTSLTGIGGVGKTALASWATLLAHEKKYFDFIVSLTAKDRALTSTGIVPLQPTLSSLVDLLREICDVTGFSELSQISDVSVQVEAIRTNILSQFKGLLFVDNLETVDDPLLISFLENLPLPTRAIVTSRKTRVRVAAQPVSVGPFEEHEAVEFVTHAARLRRKDFIAEMTTAERVRIANSCDRIPLVIEWFVGRSRSAEKALREAETLATEGHHGEELLEFSFRRIYGELGEKEQAVLKVLSLIGTQLPVEAVAAGAGLPVHEVADRLEELRDYSLVETQYDLNYKDVVHSLLPVTNTFIYREVARLPGYEVAVRKRLNDWYQAKEIVDPAQRALVQQVRRGERNPELALAEVAKNSLAAGDLDTAEQFYKLAIERNHTNWQIHRDLAEFYRHERKETAMAIQHYRYAVDHAPKQGPDRARVFREYGMVLRDSGLPNAHRLAAEQLEEALRETPKDAICRHALGDCYVKLRNLQRAVAILEPLLDHPAYRTREKTYPLLLECYDGLGDILKAAEIRNRIKH